jgi:hypothetical protein
MAIVRNLSLMSWVHRPIRAIIVRGLLSKLGEFSYIPTEAQSSSSTGVQVVGK